MIEFKNISLNIGSHQIIKSADFQIRGGEFIALVGPSGAGKSSLLKLLIGEYRPSEGEMIVDEVNISDLSSKYLQLYRRKIGMVFQDFKLLPQKTVAENIAFAMEVCEASEKQIVKTIPEVLKLVGLSNKVNSFPRQLSGGEQQRVAIARALIHQPALFIADEPTGNLDKQNSLIIIDILGKINQQGVTVIVTTHQEELWQGLKKMRRIEIREGVIRK